MPRYLIRWYAGQRSVLDDRGPALDIYELVAGDETVASAEAIRRHDLDRAHLAGVTDPQVYADLIPAGRDYECPVCDWPSVTITENQARARCPDCGSLLDFVEDGDADSEGRVHDASYLRRA